MWISPKSHCMWWKKLYQEKGPERGPRALCIIGHYTHTFDTLTQPIGVHESGTTCAINGSYQKPPLKRKELGFFPSLLIINLTTHKSFPSSIFHIHCFEIVMPIPFPPKPTLVLIPTFPTQKNPLNQRDLT